MEIWLENGSGTGTGSSCNGRTCGLSSPAVPDPAAQIAPSSPLSRAPPPIRAVRGTRGLPDRRRRRRLPRRPRACASLGGHGYVALRKRRGVARREPVGQRGALARPSPPLPCAGGRRAAFVFAIARGDSGYIGASPPRLSPFLLLGAAAAQKDYVLRGELAE